jgi:L-lactate dehydrogenase complex protein LldG
MKETTDSAGQGRVLDDIRRALGRSETVKPAPLEPFVETKVEEGSEELLARFIREVTAVGALVYRAQKGEEVGALITQICAGAGSSDVALSGSSLLLEMNLSAQLTALHLSVVAATDFGADEKAKLIARLAECGAGVTTVDYAIAESGTLALTSDEDQALLVSLLPIIHIAVIRPQQILATLTDVVTELGSGRMQSAVPFRSATFITGPSRTSDVELTLSIGVHGPKELHLIILSD